MGSEGCSGLGIDQRLDLGVVGTVLACAVSVPVAKRYYKEKRALLHGDSALQRYNVSLHATSHHYHKDFDYYVTLLINPVSIPPSCRPQRNTGGELREIQPPTKGNFLSRRHLSSRLILEPHSLELPGYPHLCEFLSNDQKLILGDHQYNTASKREHHIIDWPDQVSAPLQSSSPHLLRMLTSLGLNLG